MNTKHKFIQSKRKQSLKKDIFDAGELRICYTHSKGYTVMKF